MWKLVMVYTGKEGVRSRRDHDRRRDQKRVAYVEKLKVLATTTNSRPTNGNIDSNQIRGEGYGLSNSIGFVKAAPSHARHPIRD